MSLKGVMAKASRRRREITETPPWKRLEYGWRDRLEHADHEIILAMKARPQSFEVEIDPRDQTTVIVTTLAPRRTRHPGWKERRQKTPRQIILRLPISLFEVRENGRKGKKYYEPFFEKMLSRSGKR